MKTPYIDLLKDPDDDDGESDLGLSYGLRLHAHLSRNDYRHYWFRLGRILSYETAADIENLINETLAD